MRNLVATDSPHYQTVLSSMFKQTPKPSRGFLYDSETEIPEYAPLNEAVQARLRTIFKLHGAVEMEPPLLMPVTAPPDEQKQALFIDRHGDMVMLPNELLVSFARLAARMGIRRIKRFHIANVYRSK
jgi:eukaryotic translation initiation factor 2-alpha kinase 4